MLSRRLSSLLVAVLSLASVTSAQTKAPVAETKAFEVTSSNGNRVDPYYWIRDDTRSKPEVLDYLKAEDAYYQAMTAPYKDLTETLAKEMIARVKQDDSSVPYKYKDYVYYTRYETGKEHPVYARKAVGTDREQILVDANKEGEGKEYYHVGGRAVSANQNILAFTEDLGGRRQFTMRFRDLATGKDYDERIPGLSDDVVWANDNKTVFYIENDPVTLLSTRVKKHVLGTDPKTDPLVYEEKDTTFYMGVFKTGDQKYVAIRLGSTVSNEYRALDADDPSGEWRILAPRQRDFLYEADHTAGRWVINTDWDAPNNRLMSVADADMGDRAKWKEVLPYDKNVFVDGFRLFRDHLAIGERSGGLLRIRVVPWAAPEKAFYIKADEPAYTEYFATNAEQETDTLRYGYTSLATPETIYEVNMKTGKRKLLKQDPVLGGFKAANYATERVWATARDGTKVPVSLLYRKGFKRDGTAPMYQHAYGSYGSSSDPEFDQTILSLVDRGFVYALAHIRGGQEMGRAWYDNGKLLNKKNTFTDFVDVTDYLVKEKYAAPDKVFAMGVSAGGLLMGAISNMAPDRYRGIIAHVPYVDAVTTMLDETIPLTSNEFDEWGNPKQKVYYDYMLSYSPYDNVKAQSYPAMLVTTSLYDSQVQYYEPAKWVAKLRATKTDTNPLYFKINLTAAGHGGKSGRFEQLHETAEEYAFVLNTLGMK